MSIEVEFAIEDIGESPRKKQRPLSAAIMEHNMLQFCQSLGNIEIKKPKRFGKSTITQRLEKLKTEEEAKLYIYGLIPPILKSDIRRYYPMIFSHVYNSCDYGMVRSFIQTFMEDEINFLIKRPILGEEGLLTFTGPKMCSQFLFGRVYDAPDVTFVTSDIVFRLRADQTSTISSIFHVTGTRLVDPKMKKIMEEKSEMLDLKINESFDKLIYIRKPKSFNTLSKMITNDESPESNKDNYPYPDSVSNQTKQPQSVCPNFFDSLEFANDVISVEEEGFRYINPFEKIATNDTYSKNGLKINDVINATQVSLSSDKLQVVSSYDSHSDEDSDCDSASSLDEVENQDEVFIWQDLAKIPVVNNPSPYLKPINFHARLVMHLRSDLKVHTLEIEKIE